MLKSVFKELIIILLLLLAILLVLGVFLYDYIPTNKIVPKIEQYQVPNSIKNELQETVNNLDEQMTPIIYEIDGTDLNNYEKSNDYEKGKVNPFSETTTNNQTTNTNGNTNNSNSNNSNTNNGTNNNNNNSNNNGNNSNNNQTNYTNNNSDSVGNYLPNTGTK